MKHVILLSFFSLFLLINCATDKADEVIPVVIEQEQEKEVVENDTTSTNADTTTVVVPEGLSFKDDIEPIFTTNCTSSCHNPSPGPFPLLTHDDISSKIDRIIPALKSGKMPRGGTPLSAETIKRIEDWKSEGLKDN